MWITELSEFYEICLPDLVEPSHLKNPDSKLPLLFSTEAPDDDEASAFENLANQIADSLLSICMEVFPNLFQAVGLPYKMENLTQITPYELAVVVYNRWSTEEQFYARLSDQIKMIGAEPLQDYFRFCIQVLLYRFNIVINPKFRRFFVPIDWKNKIKTKG
jgi:hypothetical protein